MCAVPYGHDIRLRLKFTDVYHRDPQPRLNIHLGVAVQRSFKRRSGRDNSSCLDTILCSLALGHVMAEPFNHYHKWLAIPPEQQPPNAYQLLGVRLFETDLDVISNAANARMAQV